MSSATHHNATFTWPPTKSQRVVVTGTFDNWSGNTHVLERDDKTGYFKATVPVPYGEKVAYKYVVDGQWMTREDEAKEWDSAGNMNNVYTAPHAPTPTEPAATAPSTQNRNLPTSAVASSPVATSSSTQPTESRRSPDQRVPESTHVQSLAAQPVVNTTTATTSTTDKPLSANTTSPTSRTEDTSEKKHGLAAVAASAASAIGIHKGSHQGTPAASQSQTGDVPPSARSGVTTAQTGDHAPLSATHAPAASSSTSTGGSKVEQVKTKAEQLVASAVPGSSTGSKHVESTPGSQRVESASAPVAREAGVQHATTGLAGLNLGAPIGGAQSTTYNSTHTTTTTSSAGAFSSSSLTAEKPKTSIVEPKSTHVSTSEETAVAPKTEGPKTAIPQPAVVVPGAAPTAGLASKLITSETAAAPKDEGPRTAIPQPSVEASKPVTSQSALASKPISSETAAAPVDEGPRTAIPHPSVEGTTATTSSPNVPTGAINNTSTSTAQISETVSAQAEKLTHAAQQVGTSAFAAISTAASGLVIGLGDAVHAVTGVDIVHKDPVSPDSTSPHTLSDLEEGRAAERAGGDPGTGVERKGSVTGMTVPFESQLKRSPRLAQGGFPLPTSASVSSPTTTRPGVHRAPSSSASLYKSEAQELRRRSWNLNSQPSQISIEEAKRAGIDPKSLPTLENGPPSARSAEALANALTAPIPVAKDTAAQASSTASQATNNTFGQGPAVPAKSSEPIHFAKTAAPVQRSPVTTSYTDIPLPPAKDGLPAAVDDADIQAAKSVPRANVTSTGLHPTNPRISAPVHGSMAGSSPSGAAAVKANNNAATSSSPTSPKQPDVFSSNKHDKPAVIPGESEKKPEYKTDLPAQHETKSTNHKSVPMPVITSIGDSTKDRTQPSLADNAAKEVSSNPAASTHQAKAEAQAGMNNDVEGVPSRSYAKQPTNNTAVTGLPLATTQKPVSALPDAPVNPATPVKPVVVQPASAQTPASRLAVADAQASPAAGSTASSTTKKKSGFLSKVKNVFHKDKAAK